MNICKLNMLEYYIAFAGYHTALSNRYSAQVQSGGCIYGAKENGSYAGFLCISDDVDVIRITYALTLPEYRNTGVFTALVKHVTENSRSDIRIGFSSEHPCSEWMRKAVLKTGFVPTEKVTVFSCSREDEPNWQSFMEKRGERLCRTLERQGCSAVSFQEMDKELLDQLRFSDVSEYANTFHPAMFLDDPSKKLSMDLSYAALKDGKLAGYCLVTMGDAHSAIFDQISVSAAQQGRGVFLLPYVYSMQRFFERGLATAYYAMYGSNRHANAFRNSVLKIFRTEESTMENYCFFKRG